MLKLSALLVALAISAHAIPLSFAPKSLLPEHELHEQALVAIGKADAPGKFKNFLPMINQVVVYTSAVLPTVKAKKEQKKLGELTESMLVQTVVDASGTGAQSEIEKYLPTGDDVVTAMVAIGNVIGGSSGFNPMQMMTNLVGKADMAKIVDECMHFPLRFPEPSDDQVVAAEHCVLSIGLGFTPQEDALDSFVNILSEEQKAMIDSLEKNVIERLMNTMSLPNGDPTPELVDEIKRQMKVMEEKTGSTEMMPQEFQDLVKAASDESIHAQALLALGAEAPKSVGKFKNFVPLVSQSFIYAGVILPGMKSSKEHRHNTELTSSVLIQTLDDAAGVKTSNDLEKYLPTADDMLSAMVAIGNVIGGSSGFNPIELLSNVVGKDQMVQSIDELMKFPVRFPDFTEREFESAEQVALSVGLGFMGQEAAIDQFMNSLEPEKREMIESLEKNVEGLTTALVGEDGHPTSKFVDEIKRQMKVMKDKTGSTEMMPEELKELAEPDEARAQTEALIAVQATATPKQFKDFLPLLSQVVVCAGAVLPSVQAHKQHSRNSELTSTALVQTVASAAGTEVAALENAMPSADDMLTAMVAVGNVMGGSSGFNPVQMMSNILGRQNMVNMMDEIMKFPIRFPDIKDEQISAAENVVLSVGLGFINQEEALDKFYNVLDEEQKDMINSLQKNVLDKVVESMSTPEGEPSPALVEEIKAEMKEMEKRKGSTEMMPQDLKDLVKSQQ